MAWGRLPDQARDRAGDHASSFEMECFVEGHFISEPQAWYEQARAWVIGAGMHPWGHHPLGCMPQIGNPCSGPMHRSITKTVMYNPPKNTGIEIVDVGSSENGLKL